jgi:hypothetical protein
VVRVPRSIALISMMASGASESRVFSIRTTYGSQSVYRWLLVTGEFRGQCSNANQMLFNLLAVAAGVSHTWQGTNRCI